jgi:hypothetical protein
LTGSHENLSPTFCKMRGNSFDHFFEVPLLNSPNMATWHDCWERARTPIDIAAVAASSPSLESLLSPTGAVRLGQNSASGRCLVAARAIPALSEVLLDTAILWYPSSSDAMGATIPGMCELRSGLSLSDADGFLAQLAPFSPASVGTANTALAAPSAATVPRHDLYIAACALNALGALVDEDAPEDKRRLPMVCLSAALINHSCAPNCSYEGWYNTQEAAPGIRVYSEEDIAEGEEISISYVPRHLRQAERAARLRSSYGFDCACPRCSSGIEDTIEFAEQGRCIPSAPAAPEQLPPPLQALLQAREAWLESASGRPGMLTGAAGAPPPLLGPGDQQRFSALYALLGALWKADPEAVPHLRQLQCAVSAGVVSNAAACGRAGRGRCFPSDALLIAGHYHALAGLREAAAGFYATAAGLYAAIYGPADSRVALAQRLAASPPSTRAEAERSEVERLRRSRNWCLQYGLPSRVLERWVSAVPRRGGEAGKDAAAMRELLGASRAIMKQGGLLAREG